MTAAKTTVGATTSPGYEALATKAPAFLPGWSPARGAMGGTGPIEALLQVAGRYRDTLANVIDRAGPKARLAHLSALGTNLRPAQPASGTVVFTLDPTGPNGDAPAGTRLGASAPGASAPLVFETTDSIALAAAPLVEVTWVDPASGLVSLLAGTAPAASGPVPVHHALYLGDPTALAVIPGAMLDVHVTLAPFPAGTTPTKLKLAWEFYDGSLWHAFLPVDDGDDGTSGLTKSGMITLTAGQASAQPTSVNNVGPMYWIRARAESAPDDAEATVLAKVVPTVAAVSVGSTLAQSVWVMNAKSTLVSDQGCSVSLSLVDEDQRSIVSSDVSFPAGISLAIDGTPTVVPGETKPVTVRQQGDYYTLTLTTPDSVTGPDGRPATITQTQDKQAVLLFDGSAFSVTATRQAALLDKAFNDVLKVDPTSTFAPFGEAPRPGSTFVFTNADVMSHPGAQATLYYEVLPDPTNPSSTTTAATTTGQSASRSLVARAGGWVRDTRLWTAIASVLSGARGGAVGLGMALLALWKRIAGDPTLLPADLVGPPADPPAETPAADPASTTPGTPEPSGSAPVRSGGTATNPQQLTPVVALEAWTGSGWANLMQSDGTSLDPAVKNALRMDTPNRYTLSFQVPDIPFSNWAGQRGQWMRLRLVQGGYGSTQPITLPASAGGPATFTVVTTKPPRLHAPRISFYRVTAPITPSAVLSDNDYVWRDHGTGLNQAGQAFQPFIPGQDDVQTLYFGFDGGLPAGTIGVGIEMGGDENQASTGRVALEWSYNDDGDGESWPSLQVKDGTDDLTTSGILELTWPGLNDSPQFTFLAAQGNSVTLAPGTFAVRDDGTAVAPALAYPVGATFMVRDADGAESATVASAQADGWQLNKPLSRPYKPGPAGTVGPVRLARFGAPRTWVRARPKLTSTVPSIMSARTNAVGVQQIDTHSDELLGASDGAPGQNFVLRYHPVLPGEEIEVLELSGGRAAVEWSVLRDDVIAAGGALTDLRFEYDPATGRVSAAWVLWRSAADFLTAGPDDRVYVIDRALGRIVFGDGQRGMIPPAGQNAVRARLYQAGGGWAGNVPALAINQLLDQVPGVQTVANPSPTRGGADAEKLELVAPVPVTSQGVVGSADATTTTPPPPKNQLDPVRLYLANQSAGTALDRAAITPDDYARVVLDSSAAILAAICLRASEVSGGFTSPGNKVRLVVLALDDTNSDDGTYGLPLSTAVQNTVTTAINAAAPPWVARRIELSAPGTIKIDVSASVFAAAPAPGPDVPAGTPADPVAVRVAVENALTTFLDPRYIRPDNGKSWLSRIAGVVKLSDLALQVAGAPGVGRVMRLELTQDGAQTDRVVIPPGYVPVAGDIEVSVTVIDPPVAHVGPAATGGTSA